MVKCWSSKSVSRVRFPPTPMRQFDQIKLLFSPKHVGTASTLLTLYLATDWLTGSGFAQKGFLGLSMGFALYWTISIFVFLFKRSLYTSYTVVIQRYWKRALYLFWALELFLFSIYIYLVLVAPTEVEWLLDQPQLFTSRWWAGSLFFTKLLIPLTLIVTIIGAQYFLFGGASAFLTILYLAITAGLGVVLWGDAAQTFAYSVFFSGLSWGFDVETSIWSLDASMDKTRVATQYVFLLTVLKFWHTAFIAGMWLVTVMFALQSPYLGQGGLASNKQNFYFLYGFAFLWVCLLYKALNNYLYEYVYAWFRVNPWGASLVNSAPLCEPLYALL